MKLVKQKSIVITSIVLAFFINVFSIQSQDKKQPPMPYSISDNYSPTGWMGDGEFGEKNVYFFDAWIDTTRPDSHCIKIVYHNQGPKGWAGMYWQNWPNNWGQRPGDNFSKSGYTKLIFWAKGEKGGEVVKFKMGGVNPKQYTPEELGLSPWDRSVTSRDLVNWHRMPGGDRPFGDSFKITIGYVILQREWKKYTFNLKNKNLSSVIGGFCWIVDSHGNTNGLIILKIENGKKITLWRKPKKLIFYLDDIQLEE